jgi:elongation factor G
MKQYKLPDIRNVGLIGHGSSGKTSVAEAILFASGASDRLGIVGDSSSVMDYDPEEAKRGHSINASLAFCEWEKNKVNLLDTPGDNNFIADTPACIRVVDGVVVVIGAGDGIQFYTAGPAPHCFPEQNGPRESQYGPDSGGHQEQI